MRNFLLLLLAFSVSGGIFAKGKKCNTKAVQTMSFADTAAYGLGVQIGNSLKKDGLDALNVDIIAQAIKDTYKDTSIIPSDKYMAVMNTYFGQLQEKMLQKKKTDNEAYLKMAAQKPTMKKTTSGLLYEVIKEGNGVRPKATDTVTVNYRGMFLNGKVFDSTFETNEPIALQVNGVIPGWTEALQLMSEGALYKLIIPSELAYGEFGTYDGSIGPNEVLVFDVELVKNGVLPMDTHDHDHNDPNHKH